eukprot:TRINITY_DN779988_c0_g1_i1.p1 TRINITY_DN779988_c0_g1~~TRINITY_DN779988_c0_g1_i1.p1  ORF type:complete len:239 (+),score=54.84 TRINITY_DN779988_c0_g1_i1:38-718(+)
MSSDDEFSSDGFTTSEEESEFNESENEEPTNVIEELSFEQRAQIKKDGSHSKRRERKAGFVAPKRKKGAPLEMSSKRPIKPAHMQKKKNNQTKVMDPRFDPMIADVNSQAFSKSYKFLEESAVNDIAHLKKQMKRAHNEEDRQALAHEISNLSQYVHNRKAQAVKQKTTSKWKKEEMEKISQGKRPFFPKRNQMKRKSKDAMPLSKRHKARFNKGSAAPFKMRRVE